MHQDCENPEQVAQFCNASFTRSKCGLSDDIKHFSTESAGPRDLLLLEHCIITKQKYVEESLGKEADKD